MMEETHEKINESRRRFLALAVGTIGAAATGTTVISGLAPGTPPSVDEHSPKPADLSETLLRDFTICEEARKAIPSQRQVVLGKSKEQVITYKNHTYQFVNNSLNDDETHAQAFALREISTSGTPPVQESRLEKLLHPRTKGGHYEKASSSESQFIGNELILLFPGRTDGKGTVTENAIVNKMFNGERSKQVAPIEQWLEKEIIPYLQEHPEVNVHIFGHSMGSGNALAAKYLVESIAQQKPREVQATLYEPFAATQEASYIVNDAVADNTKNAEAIENALRRDVTSIRVQPRTGPASLPVGESSAGNKQFGDKVFILNPHPSSPLADDHPVVNTAIGAGVGATTAATMWIRRAKKEEPDEPHPIRRAVGAVMKTAGTVTVTAGGALGGIIASDFLNSTAHTIVAAANILNSAGNDALTLSKDETLLSTQDEVLHPERYPVSIAEKIKEKVSIGYTGVRSYI
jgi:hypothetical protein